MSTPFLVQEFYAQIWNGGNLEAAAAILADDFRFRGSLGAELDGRQAFEEYVRYVRGALSDYRCEILDCVCEEGRAFAKMHFSGLHTGEFRGYPPTGRPIEWLGAALFKFDAERITDLWVLGDLASLDAMLGEAAELA